MHFHAELATGIRVGSDSLLVMSCLVFRPGNHCLHQLAGVMLQRSYNVYWHMDKLLLVMACLQVKIESPLAHGVLVSCDGMP